jgi:quercetin dioxygenase-like cupin family protein
MARMKELNRRDVFVALSAFAALGSGVLEAQTPSTATGADNPLAHSRVFHFSELELHKGTGGMETREVVRGNLLTGEYVELHQTTLPVGMMPHPPHKHQNSEFLLIREGKLEYQMDGRVDTVMPGDIIYTASNQGHGLRNIGDVPARYFVVSVGVQPGATPVTLVPPRL